MPQVSGSAQNWCDLFFILDILAANTDPAAVLVFLGRKDSHVPDLADKEVILEGFRTVTNVSRWTWKLPL